MIGYLRGSLLDTLGERTALVMTTGGVGYEVEVTRQTLEALRQSRDNCALYTYFIVREDAQKLYGFISNHEKEMFHLLLKVNGVGGKVALSVLETFSVGTLFTHIYNADSKSLQQVSGLGKKTAERLILEMKDLIKKLNQHDLVPVQPIATAGTPIQDAKSALLVLGYKPAEAERAIERISNLPHRSTEEIIKMVLQGKE